MSVGVQVFSTCMSASVPVAACKRYGVNVSTFILNIAGGTQYERQLTI